LLEAGGEVHGNDARADASFLAGTASVASEVLVGGGASGGRAGVTASVADITFVVGDEEVVVGGAELADTVAFGGGGVAAVGEATNGTRGLQCRVGVDTGDVLNLVEHCVICSGKTFCGISCIHVADKSDSSFNVAELSKVIIALTFKIEANALDKFAGSDSDE
jgi:hypothetical protein